MPTQAQLELVKRLNNDPRFYAHYALKVKDKATGKLLPFDYNVVQNYLHGRIEAQKKRIGMVRGVGIKGRQQGFSELVQGRYFHAANTLPNTKVYVLSHENKSTRVLFSKALRYQENLPPELAQELDISNQLKLKFANKSEYELGTANNESTGRSDTVQRLHLSEPAHYPEGAEEGLRSGLLQTVADLSGTEIIWETTCNGHNWFYHFWLSVLAGETLYEPWFVPWFWTPEYRLPLPEGWRLTDEELVLHKQYGVDDHQLAWRRNKITELKSIRLFRQEYPFTADEAFQSSGAPFFDAELVEAAQRSEMDETTGPLILGCDPARTGDRTVIIARRGRRVLWIEKYKDMEQTRLAGILANHIERLGVDKCFIDWAHGHGVVDILRERGFGPRIEGINFGQSADEEQYLNKRAEMFFALKDWLSDGEVRLPRDQDMAADIAMLPDFVTTSNGKIKFPSKDEIKKVSRRSPDILDALALTFAYPVYVSQADRLNYQNALRVESSELSSLRRVRSDGVGDNDGFYEFDLRSRLMRGL